MAAPDQTTYRKYNVTVNNYAAADQGFINVVQNCNSLLVMNIGDTIAFFNGFPLFPSATPATVAGDAIEISGNELDTYKGNLKLSFAFPVGAAPQVVIVQQYYI